MKVFRKLLTFLSRQIRRVIGALYVLLAIYVTLLSGCRTWMPTMVGKNEAIYGTKVPNIKGVTLIIIEEYMYKFQAKRLELWAGEMEIRHEISNQIYDEGINFLNMGIAAGAFGGIPLALKKVPKGYRKEES